MNNILVDIMAERKKVTDLILEDAVKQGITDRELIEMMFQHFSIEELKQLNVLVNL